MNPQTPSNSRQLLIIVGAVALVLMGIITYFLLASHHSTSSKSTYNPNSGQYYDSNSHQTVSNPVGKGPEINSTPGAPIYLGISNLLNYGLGSAQLTALKTAFLNYSNSLPTHIKQVSVTINSIEASQKTSGGLVSFTISFKVVLDQTTDDAVISYTNPTQMELVLSNTAGAQVFDSGVLGTAPSD